MDSVEALRRDRYRVAKSLFAGTYGSPREQKTIEAVLVESARISDLEVQYADASKKATELLAQVEQEVVKTERASQQAAKEMAALQAAIDHYKRARIRPVPRADADPQRDSGTYATASALLDERIAQAHTRLEAIQATIQSFEPKPYLKNPQAQELYLQLRALLTAQEKELRALLRPFTRTL
jgi:hypothetical protein